MAPQLQLKQKMSFSQILRTHGKQFMQIRKRYSDGHNGRCAIGVLMSYCGWKPTSIKYGGCLYLSYMLHIFNILY